MASTGVPIPLQDPLARPKRKEYEDRKDPIEGTATLPWIQYFQALESRFQQAPIKQATPVSLTAQAASIGATEIVQATLNAGLYRVSYAARVTRAATTSSTLTVAISWTAGGVTQAISGSAMTGNTTATFQTNTYLIKLDQAAPITYATTYGSVGGTTMLYELSVVLENVAT